MKLNLGSGQKKLAGYLNVDKYPTFEPDEVCDLEVFPWPFPDSSADEIVMSHVLEHLGAQTETFLGVMKELYRVLTPGGRLDITAPHPRSEAFLGDPTHVRVISPAVLSLFSKENNRKWKLNGGANTLLALYLDIDFEIISVDMSLTPRWAEKYASGKLTDSEISEAAEMHHNVVDEIHMILRKAPA
jgi:SAM-dependent methyltransferase